MKRIYRVFIFTSLILTAGLALSAHTPQVEEKTFAAKKTIRLEMVSGDCIIKTGVSDKIEVRLAHDYEKGDFDPQFKDQGDSLLLKEEFSGHANGHSIWNITMPAKTGIEFSSASGNLEAIGGTAGITVSAASGDITLRNFSAGCEITTASGNVDLEKMTGNTEVETASGDVELKNMTGKIHIDTASGEIRGENIESVLAEIQSASGDIEIRQTKGGISVSTASGDVRLDDVTLEKAGKFTAASGNVTIKLAAGPKEDVTVSTASGDIVLDYNGQAMVGTFELSAKKDARINAPFSFDKEEEFLRYGQTYIRKTVTRQGSTPRIEIKTASGRTELRK